MKDQTISQIAIDALILKKSRKPTFGI